MKLRIFPVLLLTIAVLLGLTGSVEARSLAQGADPQENIIIQVLEATAQQLGWPTTVDGPLESSALAGMTQPHIYYQIVSASQDEFIDIKAFGDASKAANWFFTYLYIPFPQPSSFHGLDAVSGFNGTLSNPAYFAFLSGRFEYWVHTLSVERASQFAETLYQNASGNGLIGGNTVNPTDVPATQPPTAATATITPTVQASPIVLKASLEGYGEDTQKINNDVNFEAVIIEGKVTDQEGKGVDGANVEVVSGADAAAISTNADGSYMLVVNVPGGQGSGSLKGVDFTLQLEGDLSIARIEILQAVSGAELVNSRHTAVLVFPRFSSKVEGSAETAVSLYVNGQLLPGSPISVRVKSQYTDDDKKKVYDAVKFFVPPSYVRAGVFEVKAVIDPENLFVEPEEGNNEKTWSQMVTASRGLSLLMVDLSANSLPGGAQAWAATARRFLANTYPVPSVRIVQHPVHVPGNLSSALAMRDAQLVTNALAAYNNANPATRVEYAVGLFPGYSYGAGNRGFVYRHLYPTAPFVSLNFPKTLAHEIGHIYLGGTEESTADAVLHGISLPEGYVYDYITGQVRYLKPGSNWINFMGDPYAGLEDHGAPVVKPWISPTAWNTILRARQTAQLPQARAKETAQGWSANAPFSQVLYLSGYFDYGELQLLPPLTLNTSEVGDYPAGEYTATIEAADGSALASVTFAMNYDLGEGGLDNPGSFSVEVPYPAGAARLVITSGGQEFYRLEKTTSAPTVSVAQPGGGSEVDGETTVTWTASDGDGDALTYNVFYSSDGGASWQLLAMGISDPQALMDGSLLPGGEAAMVRVEASDGLNTAQADSSPFVVPLHTPTVTILPPDPEAEAWVEGHANLLAAVADDIEDGWLAHGAYQWTSDVDGDLGQGNALYVALSAGTHSITVTATDADGQQATATAIITVGASSSSSMFNIPGNVLYIVGGGVCLALLLGGAVIGGVLVFSARRQRRRMVAVPGRQSRTAESAEMVQDEQGYWWSQDQASEGWSLWNGTVWQAVQTPPNFKSARPGRMPRGYRRSPGASSCIVTLGVMVGLIVLVGGAVALVALNFLPGVALPSTTDLDMNTWLSISGGSLLLIVLGALAVNGGWRSIVTRRARVEDDYGYTREVRGCSAVLNGIISFGIGLLLLIAGLGAAAVIVIQQAIALLGSL